MFPSIWRKWIRKSPNLGRVEQLRRDRQCLPRIEGLELRLVPAFTSTTPFPLSLTETSAATGVVVAAFTTDTPTDTFTATVDWGDGTTTAGTIAPSGANSFSVTGSHTYAEDGSYTASIALTETGISPDAATVTDSATVSESSFLLGGIAPTTITEGQTFSGTVATFSDPGSPDAASAFSATIDWGDGTTDVGTVTGSAGFYTVSGTHTYTDELSGNINVLVSEPSANFDIGPTPDSITVTEADTLSGTAPGVTATEGSTFNGAVATFTNTGFPGNTAGDFTATIDWGDGTVTAGVVSGGSGLFTVSGIHTYADEGSFTTTVALTDDAPGTASATATGTANVLEGDFGALTPATINATEAAQFTGAVASFTDPGNPSQVASDWTATIDWGDGTTTPGTVTGGTGGPFTISGSHTYAEDGSYTTIATFSDDPPSTLTNIPIIGTAQVAEAGFVLSGIPPTAITEGQTFSGTVATFTDPGSPDPASAFLATIDWGDGTTDVGTVTGSAGIFTVSGTHTYTDELNGNINVTVSEPDANFTIGPNPDAITVAEADSLSGSALGLTATEGTSFSGAVATFTNAGFPGNTAGDFTATIDWGDGTTDVGTVSGGSGLFTVSGSHTYLDEGSFTTTVILTDDAPGTASATATGTATAAEGDTLVGTGLTFSALEMPSAFTGAVATFSDAGYPNNSPTDFTATIDWGDGTITAGTVSGGSGSNFTVSGSHTYAEDGSYTTSVTLTDDAPGTATATATGAANVGESELSITAVPVVANITEGVQFSVVLATATDPSSPDQPSEFSAMIDWGDGTTTAGDVAAVMAGSYTVGGTHTYSDEGSFTATVTFFENNDPTFTVSVGNPVSVDEADVLAGTGLTVSGTEGRTFTGAVATFTDTGFPGNTAGDFTATIDWGDGTTSAGTVSGGSGLFTVSGSHNYADEGSFTTTVILTDDAPGTASATATGAASVAEGDVLAGTGLSVTVTENSSFSGSVATFTDTGFPGNTAGDFTATIDWGDGTITPGTVSGGAGLFTVSGSHTYADEGSFTTSVTLTDDAPGTATATATGVANVSEADVLAAATAQPSVSVAEADGSTNLNVAVFANAGYPSNPASDFTATIDWGDGTTTAGTVTADGAGNYTVSGAHAYADEGNFTATVVLTDDAPGTASATVTNQVTVTEADALIPTGTTFTGTEGFLFSGQVASFTNTGYPTNPATDFTATIDWGDGTTTAGTVSGGGGTFAVNGDHLYKAPGHFTVSVTLIDDAPGTASATAITTAAIQEQLLAAGTGAGEQPLVHIYDAVSGNLIASFDAFAPAFLGGVRVAVGDVNGDGVPDVIVAAGPGGGPHVKVIDGTKLSQVDSNGEIENSALLASFYAYDPNFNGGVFLAFGVSEGLPEIITGAGPGGSPHVKVIDTTKMSQLQNNSVIADSALVAQFYAYSPFFNGGVRVAAADLNGDQVLDIVTGAGPGGGPHVKVIDGDRLNELDNNAEISNSALIGQFYADTPTVAPSGGVYVAATDIGGHPVIITGDGAQADGSVDGPRVKVIDATRLNLLDSNSEPTGAALLGSFFAYDPAFQGGVTVGVAETNGDGRAAIITGAGPGGGPHVRVVNGELLNDLLPNQEIADSALLDNFFAFSPFFNGGVFIGAGT